MSSGAQVEDDDAVGRESTGGRSKKQPPPEKAEAVWLRTKVIFSFWAVIVCLGLPVWWKTTSIYRARLPIQEMLEWSEGRACQPVLPLEIWVVTPTMICEDARHVVEIAQDALDNMNPLALQPIRLRVAKSRPLKDDKGQPVAADPDCFLEEYEPDSSRPALKLHLVPDEEADEMTLSFDPASDRVDLRYGEVSTRALGSYAASAVHCIFVEEQAAIAYKVAAQGSNHVADTYLESVSEEIKSALTSRENRALKYAANYHLTFSLFTPTGSPSSWAIESALETHIEPWIRAFSATSNFSINTQIQPYSGYAPSIHPYPDPETQQMVLSREDLSGFINAAEWPLSPSIGSPGPTIHFIVYVPSAAEVPLSIGSSHGRTSWLIPQYGGVAILNPALVPDARTGLASIPPHLDLDALTPPFQTFSTQLASLLGLPMTPAPQLSSSSTTTTTTKETPLPQPLLPLPLRLQTHTRLQTLSLHHSTLSTLTSLSHLSRRLSNIPIPASVASLVSSTLSHLTATCGHWRDSDWGRALEHGRAAWQDSERAFFDKTMVGQLYFPDEHKVAVYLPLLGPVGVPLLVALGREVGGGVRWLVGRRVGG